MSCRIVLSSLLVLVATSVAWSQPTHRPILFGSMAGTVWGKEGGSVPVYEGSAECGVFESGSINEVFGGLRFALPRLFNEWGLGGTVEWSVRRGTMTTTPVDQQFIRSVEDGGLVELDRRYQLRSTTNALRIELLGQMMSGDGWTVSLGPSFALLSSTVGDQIDTILGPGRTSFSDGQRSHAMPDGTELRSASLAVDGVVSLSYALPVGGHLSLVPELRTRFGITSAMENVPLRTTVALGGALGLLFDLSPRQLPPDLPDTVPPPPPHIPLLTASIDLRGVDLHGRESDRATVTVDELLSRRYIPLLPMVFFEADSATPARRYVPAGTPLGALDPMAMHLRAFQVIGQRMQSETSARLTLYGSVAQGEAPSLARKRAEAVRDKLVREWGIAPARISIGRGDGGVRRSTDAEEDGRAENRRVVIRSNSSRILAPFIVEKVERSFDPPGVVAHPTMRAEAGVQRWEVTLRQGDAVVQRTSSDREQMIEEMSWRIEAGDDDTTLTPISATLEVIDSTGARVTAHDEMPVSIRRRTQIVGGRGEDRADSTVYTLVAFNYGDTEPGVGDRLFLDEIVATLGNGDRVRVVGFTDRLGPREYNAALSRRRAERVGNLLSAMAAPRALESIEVIVEGEGVNESRFTNDLPEGRIFSRGVQVSVVRAAEGER